MLSFLFILLSLTLARADFPDCANGPLKTNLVCNPNANYLDRAKALVNLFTLEELTNNTVYTASGVPRLGLPPYNWWSEALVRVLAAYLVIYLLTWWTYGIIARCC